MLLLSNNMRFFVVLLAALAHNICAKKVAVPASVSASSAGAVAACVFPEARERPFFFDIGTDVPVRSILVDTVVEPTDAKLSIANIRANNMEPDVDLDAQLALEKRANGQFLVITAVDPPVVRFPDYPSTVNDTLLYVTVRCNGRLYPLMTVRVRNANMHTPEFLGTQPYEISIARNSPAGTLYETPLKALDLDPADQYPITFGIEPPFDRDFALVSAAADQPPADGRSGAEEARLLAALPPAYSKRVEHWHQRQMPSAVQLKVLAKSLAMAGKSVYYLNVSANDNGQPEQRVAYAQLKVSAKEAREAAARFSRSEYFANFTKEMVPGSELPPNGEQPIVATFPAQRIGDRVRYALDQANPYAQLFELDPWTGRLRLAQRVPDGVPQAIEMVLTAQLIPRDGIGTQQQQLVRTKLTLTDQTEVRLTYFAQCHYDAHLAENPSAYTRVVHFNFRGDVQGVELLNGSDLFKVDSDGVMSVRPGVDIDRESVDRIIVKARLRSRGPLHPRSLELCQIATVDLRIDDVNDHSPRFTRRAYHFRIDAHPFNNTEVGTLRAVDGDKGEFGRVRYRLLEEFVPDGRGGEEPVPFVLFQADGASTLFYVVKPLHVEQMQLKQGGGGQQQLYQPQQDYTFTVEAYDSTEDPRTARVTVNVRLADLTEEEADREREKAVRERQADHHQHQQQDQFELQQDEPSAHLEAEEEEREQDSVVVMSDDSQAPPLPQQQQDVRHSGAAGAHAVPTLVLDGTGAKKQLGQVGNKFGDLLPSDGDWHTDGTGSDGLVRFGADKYTFRLHGPLTEGQTIGTVHAKRMDGTEEIEFAVEEGIAGFVGVESGTGRLFVGPWLLRDRFEEIRFSVAAQQPSGQVLATALVSVLIDDLGPPEFSAPHYQFELDQSGETWPRLVGQAIPFTGNDQNGTAVENGNPSAIFFYALDDDRPNDSTQQQPIRWLEIDEHTGQISATVAPIGIDDRRKTVKFGVKACLRANATICGRSSVEVVVFNNNNNNIAENSAAAPMARIEFIPLPRTVFLTTGKQPGSAILRVSVRAFDPRDGTWRLMPHSLSASDPPASGGDQVAYSVASSDAGDQQQRQSAADQLFCMRDNVLTLVGRPVPGEYNLTIRARLLQLSPVAAVTPDEWSRRRVAAAAAAGRDSMSSDEHSLRVIVMRDAEGRQRYPVFERISYEFTINTGDDNGAAATTTATQRQHFPIALRPSLNASLAGGQPIRFSLFPARAGDPTDGLQIDEHSGQLVVHRQFVDAATKNRSSGGGDDKSQASSAAATTTTEVFIVVRATNQAQPQFYSDASVALLLVRPGAAAAAQPGGPPVRSMPEFDTPLYRIIVREDAPVGTVLNQGAPIGLVEPDQHPNVQLQLRSPPVDQTDSTASSLIDHFQLLENGLLVLIRQIDIERMDDASKGVIELEVVADQPTTGSTDQADQHHHHQQPARASVQIQVLDVDEFAPRFVPSSPEFRLRAPLIAGQPIGHLNAHDDDFSDRQPGTLVYRAILGNASELVHVQRDGTLLVKDPKSWDRQQQQKQRHGGGKAEDGQQLGTTATLAPLFLLVEVHGTDAGGQMASTSVKFTIDEEQEDENGRKDNGEDGDTLTTVDSRGTTIDFTAIPVQQALFSVRDSLSPDEQAQHRAGLLSFRLDEQTARNGLFRVDAHTGELYMEENTAFNGMPTEETEHQLSVEVVDTTEQQRLVARRTFTVRLVQRTTTAATITTTMPTSSSSTEAEGTTNEQPTTTTTSSSLGPAAASSADGSADQQQDTSNILSGSDSSSAPPAAPSSDGTTTTTTNSKTTTSEQQQEQSDVDGGGDREEETSMALLPDELDEPFGTTTDILPAFSVATPPNAAAARRAPTATPLVPQSGDSSGTPSTSSSRRNDSLKFALPRYHWIVTEPAKQALIGKLEMHGDHDLLDSLVIEPPQFRTWFQLDQKSGELYLREVPDQLYGRQRAEFRAHLSALDGRWTDAVVVVDLNLPPKHAAVSTTSSSSIRSTSSSKSSGAGGGDGTAATGVPPMRDHDSTSNNNNRPQQQQQSSTPADGIEIAESSDQASRTVAAAAASSDTNSLPKPASTPSPSTPLSSSLSTRTTAASSTASTPEQRHRFMTTNRSRWSTARLATVSTSTWSTMSTTTASGASSHSTDQSNERTTIEQSSTDHFSTTSARWSSSTALPTPTVGDQQNELHFASDQYRAMLPEGRYGNSGALLSLRPQPLAQGMPRGVEFSIITADQLDQQQQLPFFVRHDTGELIAFAEVDREEQAQYQFRVRAFDPSQNRSAETHVTVHILDVNDNFPQFVEPLPRVIAVGRLSTPGTLLARFNAVDLDEGAHGTVRFLMTSSDDEENSDGDKQHQQQQGEQLFSMEPDGRLMFQGLPPQQQQQQHDGAVQQEIFALRISAIDGGRPALRTEHKLRIELFAEGQPPAFKQADFVADRVPAGAAQNGTFVAQVVAGTSDQIEYSLIDPPTANLFMIDSRTGQIRMGRRPLDAERGREWALHVRAMDGHGDRATSSRTTVHVFLEAFRPDSVEAIGPEQLLPFSTSSTSIPTTTAATVEDGFVPSLSGECRFIERVFRSEIAENTEGRQRLITLGTTDGCAGRKLRFTLQQNNDAFVLDEQSGDLYAVQPLDRERKSLYFLVANMLVMVTNDEDGNEDGDAVHPPAPPSPSSASSSSASSSSASSAAVPVGMATVREVQLELHHTEQHHHHHHHPQQQAPASTVDDDGTTEEENESAVEGTSANNRRKSRQTKTKPSKEMLFNGVVEQAKSKLTPSQALVLVHVLDRNDNTPQIEHLNGDGQLVFTVDWQLPLLGQIGRVVARDADEHANLVYKLEQQSSANTMPLFGINETTGVITLIRSLQSDEGAGDEFCLNVMVSDGQHVAKAPLLIYKLQPGTNIVLLVINQPVDQVDVLRAVRHMNALLHGMDADVLVKQVFIGEDGQADPARTHLLVYAVDSRTRVPVPAAKLKELLDAAFGPPSKDHRHQAGTVPATPPADPTVVADSPLRYLATVYVPEYTAAMEHSVFRLTTAEITLLAISVLLVFCVCVMLFVLLRCCKNKQQTITKSDVEYMLDAQQAGPRPYNVELITRKMAQSGAAAARRMPKALEQCTLSPESRASMVASAGIYSGSGGGTAVKKAATATETNQRRAGHAVATAAVVAGARAVAVATAVTDTTPTTTTTATTSSSNSNSSDRRSNSSSESSSHHQQHQLNNGAGAGHGGQGDENDDDDHQHHHHNNNRRSDLLHKNLLMVRRRNSDNRGASGPGGGEAAHAGNNHQQRRRARPITYERYDDNDIATIGNNNAGAAVAPLVPHNDAEIDGGPMLDTMCSSMEHSPEMARASGISERVGSAAGATRNVQQSGVAMTATAVPSRRGAPPREPPPPPGANSPPVTNIAGRRQQQAATIIGTTRA